MKTVVVRHCLFVVGLLAATPLTTQAQSVYAHAGFPGVGVGAAWGVSPALTLRADVSRWPGTVTRSRTVGKLGYEGQIRARQAGGYADWFPFGNGFRLTAGVLARRITLDAQAHPAADGTVTVGDTTVAAGPGDSAQFRVRLPTVAPYVGIGWGHNVAQRAAKPGFGFLADLGVAYGNPQLDFSVSDTIRAKLNQATGGAGQAAIDAQVDKTRREARRARFLPQVHVGVAYYF